MLKCITLTGADDSTQPSQLFELSKEFPFVEWGILLSKRQRGNPRYPSADWLDILGVDYHLLVERLAPANFSLHLCGEYVRQFLKGYDDFASDIGMDLFEVFQRIQINTHGENHEWNLDGVSDLIARYPDKEFIFQIDGNSENYSKIILLHSVCKFKNIALLFDLSSGTGVEPKQWDMPSVANLNTGYAGGLSAENLETNYTAIKEALAQRTDFTNDHWLDMETRVRDFIGDADIFSMDKCREVLQVAKVWFEQPISKETPVKDGE